MGLYDLCMLPTPFCSTGSEGKGWGFWLVVSWLCCLVWAPAPNRAKGLRYTLTIIVGKRKQKTEMLQQWTNEREDRANSAIRYWILSFAINIYNVGSGACTLPWKMVFISSRRKIKQYKKVFSIYNFFALFCEVPPSTQEFKSKLEIKLFCVGTKIMRNNLQNTSSWQWGWFNAIQWHLRVATVWGQLCFLAPVWNPGKRAGSILDQSCF